MANELYKAAMKDKGKADAADFQSRSADMTGTEMYAEEDKIPDFQAAKAVMNMLQRPVGFVCRSTAGRVVKLLQVYDSNTYPGEPETLSAQWGFKWSTDPAKAREFVSISTSPYMTGDCCLWEGKIYRSNHDNNVWSPTDYATYWDEVSVDDGPYEPTDEPEPEEPETGGEETTEPEEPGETTEPDEPTTEPEEPETEQPDPYQQPTGAHDAYNNGDRVTFNGHIYECNHDGTVYSPDEYPAWWNLIE